SLGCILFKICCGRPPFLGQGAGEIVGAHLHVPPPPVQSLAPEMPAPLAALIGKMLEKQPEPRPQTIAPLSHALPPTLPPRAPPPAARPPGGPRPPGRPAAAAARAALVAAVRGARVPVVDDARRLGGGDERPVARRLAPAPPRARRRGHRGGGDRHRDRAGD